MPAIAIAPAAGRPTPNPETIGEQIVEHLDAFHGQVTAGEFPGDTATSRMDPEERDAYLGESTED
jgi:hypothetical protein